MRNLSVCLLAALPLCAGADPAPSSPYGVCAHLARGGEFKTRVEEMDLMREARIAWARTDFDWSGVQPDKDTWTFEHLDTLLADAEKAGIQLLPILDYSVSFANPAHRHLDLWEKYVRALVERYRARLPVWEVWNEQNIPNFWKDPDQEKPDPAAYLPLLKRTYETIKSIDPKLTVAVGGYAGIPYDYIEKLYEFGGGKYFDIMNVHPYSQPEPPEVRLEERLARLRDLMAKHGDASKPVWITELGWPTQKHRLAAPGLLKRGLAAANPKKKGPWRILVLDEPGYSDGNTPSAEMLNPELPPNSHVQWLPLDALTATLDNYAVDAVILPFDENIPETGFDRLLAYVRDGGTLVDFNGFPGYYPRARAAEGGWEKSDKGGFRERLRIGLEAWWWNKDRVPEKMPVRFTGPAADLPLPKGGLTGERFLRPHAFKEGDRFIPLVQGVTDAGYTGTVAAVYAFDSDYKGALVVSTLFEHGQRGISETAQAAFFPRAQLIAAQAGVERFFWYEFQAPEADDLDQESHFGLVHRDLSPKPAYHACKALTAMRPAGSVKLDRPWKSEDGSLYHPQWRLPDGRAAGAVWAWRKPGLYKLTFSSKEIALTSHTGEPAGTDWNGTSCILPLTDAPVYFTGGTLEGVGEAPDPAEALRAMVPNSFAAAASQYRGMLKRLEGTADQFPRRWENGQLVTVGPKEWTSGFFPGSLWYLYEYTRAPEWKEAALRYTAMLEQIRHFTGNHDIGFMLGCSFGNGLRLANPDGYREVLLDGAAALCTRFVPRLGLIRSWDNHTNPVIIDNMMNLELLMWAAKQSGEKRFSDVALSHADQTDRRHFRPDGSAYHIVDYNPRSGKILGYHAGQGASADGPWARGQSWGLYGFTMMHRETKKPEYLARAVSIADFLVGHRNLPADKVPYWDYEAAEIPHAPRDCSAAAIMASALLELADLIEHSPIATRYSLLATQYRDTAVRQLLSLSSPAYRAPVGENGNFILMHGVGHLPGTSEIDVPLNYADYYFLEGLLRFKRLFP
jgi:hypothetical protein